MSAPTVEAACHIGGGRIAGERSRLPPGRPDDRPATGADPDVEPDGCAFAPDAGERTPGTRPPVYSARFSVIGVVRAIEQLGDECASRWARASPVCGGEVDPARRPRFGEFHHRDAAHHLVTE